jgi:hypothetical protein
MFQLNSFDPLMGVYSVALLKENRNLLCQERKLQTLLAQLKKGSSR